jgi:radical SAM-linked protein
MTALDRPPEPRQRWRIAFSRVASAPSAGGNDQDAWRSGLMTCGLPVLVRSGPQGRPSLTFAAPLPAGVAGERELAEVVLTERLPADRVRAGLKRAMPPGHSLLTLHDVWLGEPPLAGQVAAADYKVTLSQPAPTPSVIRSAIAAALGSGSLPRTRTKGTTTVAYDLRPLLSNVTVAADGPPMCLRIRVRHHPERGRGRPEEVVAALGEACGAPNLTAAAIVRERIVLRGDPDVQTREAPA